MAVDYLTEFKKLTTTLIEGKGSDLHLVTGSKPMLRINGGLMRLTDKPVLTDDDAHGFAKAIMRPQFYEKLATNEEVDFSYQNENHVRFRGNAYYQQGGLGIVLRLIPNAILSVEELNLPPILNNFTERTQGFFLCVGPVGQGKSTTLAAMVNRINHNRTDHIVTIEDPIEYVYTPDKSSVDQREIGIDSQSFESALHSVFRQDVDVILVGEMRNSATIATAVTAAETGHLVLSTLHTNDAAQTINRIVDSFSGDKQDQIRTQLAASLIGIFSQRLIPRIGGGLVPAYELLINNHAVANLIRDKRVHEIYSVIETGLEHGMIDMNRSLVQLVQKGEITAENAFLHSANPKGLERLI